jgi:hypothetical protein
MDVQSLRQYWKLTLKLDCPHCDEVHDVRVREAYLDSAVEGLEPTAVQRAMVRRNADRTKRSAAPRIHRHWVATRLTDTSILLKTLHGKVRRI